MNRPFQKLFLLFLVVGSTTCLFADTTVAKQTEKDKKVARESDAETRTMLRLLINEIKTFVEKRDQAENERTKKLSEWAAELRSKYKTNKEDISKIEPQLDYRFENIEAWHQIDELKREKHIISLYWQELGKWRPKRRMIAKNIKLHEKLRFHEDDFQDFPLIAAQAATWKERLIKDDRQKEYPFLQQLEPIEERKQDPQLLTFKQLFLRHRRISGSALTMHPNIFSHHKQDLRAMLALRWNEGRLELDRAHWENPRFGKSSEQIRMEVDQQIAGRGLSDYLVPLHQNDQPKRMPRPPLIVRFKELSDAFLQEGNGRFSTGRQSASFSNAQISARIEFDEYGLLGYLNERSGDQSDLFLKASRDRLKIQINSPDQTFFLSQSESGQVNVLMVVDGESTMHQAASFADLYRNRPDFVEGSVFRYLKHHGFVTPIERFDVILIWSLVRQLQANKSSTEQDPLVVVRQLNDDRFQTRENAREKIRNNFYNYDSSIRQERKRTNLSFDYRTELTNVARSHKNRFGGYDDVIDRLKLKDDVAYLIQLTSILQGEHKNLLCATLGELTDVNFGNNAQAWKDWFDKQQR